MRIKLTIAYDGRTHEGWQSQAGGNTIQDHLERAIAATAKQEIRIHGSGRTDAGVHALAQTAHFDAPDHLTMRPDQWVPALNTKLPPSIRVTAGERVGEDFHARFSATAKTYRFEIRTDPVLPPFVAGLAWHVTLAFDPERVRATLAGYLGYHDFRAFAALRGNEKESTDFRRNLLRAECRCHDNGCSLIFSANGFLYKMIRYLSGTAIRAGQGTITPAQVAALLDQPPSLPLGKAPYCAPPEGLFLEQVHYAPP